MACCSIYNRRISNILAIMNHDRPYIDKDKEGHRCKLLQREEEREQMVWYALCEAVQWVKSMGCIRGWHDPFVMRLMQLLVDQRVMQATVDPVNAEVCKQEEEREL